jgi:hypothetical protein
LLALNNALRNKKTKNYKKQSIFMVSAAMSFLLLAGTILTPIQLSYAAPRTNGFSDTSSLKHGIRDSINVNLEHRDQHLDQENLCYRDNTCRQSNVGQNTLGNDNSVTGFADQSDNLKQSASPIMPTTSANQTTGNSTSLTPSPTPSPTPTTTSNQVTGSGTASNTSPDTRLTCPNGSALSANITFQANQVNGMVSGTWSISDARNAAGTSFGDKSGTFNGGNIGVNNYQLTGIENVDVACSQFGGGFVPNPISISGQCGTGVTIRFFAQQIPQNPITGFPPFAENGNFTGNVNCISSP